MPGPVLKRRCFSDNICIRNDQESGECFALVGSSGCSDSRRVFLLEPHLPGGIIPLCPTSDVSWAEAQRSLVPQGSRVQVTKYSRECWAALQAALRQGPGAMGLR